MKYPFNKPYMAGKELEYITAAHRNRHLSGNGPYTRLCQGWIETLTNSKKALLTHSCTGALEMAAILANIQPGDEIIMPSYTFVSTANAFILRGGIPVFVDIRPDTLNIDETLIEAAITPKTKAIVPVHYAGVACEMDTIMAIANQYNLIVIEDAAQAITSTYKGQALGSIGHFGTLSFHETKNIICGEGGALLINDDQFTERAEIIWEKGTNRKLFLEGSIDKYTWVDIGSSYLPGEITAAFLYAQMEECEEITERRLKLWKEYHDLFSDLELSNKLRRPIIPNDRTHNAHMYYVLLSESVERSSFISDLNQSGVNSVFHYIPLHSSPAGKDRCRTSGELAVTEKLASQLLRLPMWLGLNTEEVSVIFHEKI